MEKQDLKRSLSSHVGGGMFITAAELTSFMGYSRANAQRIRNEYLTGLDRVGTKYFIPDVATRIYERRNIDDFN